MMPDDLVALALDESFDAFEDVLQRAGAVHRKTRANQQKTGSAGTEKTRTSIANELEWGPPDTSA